MDFGNRIARARKKKNLSQQNLADKLFVTDKTISSWETNRTEPSLEFILKLSEILECSMSYLIFGDVIKNDIETEIKIKLTEKEFNYLKNFFNNNAVFIKESNQNDTYYQPIYRKFLKNNEPINEWLRIGIRGNKKILNYKNWYDNIYCDELEVEIDDDKNLDKIFTILGLEKIVIVNKTRNAYWY